jgi:hypothetical protein
MCRAALPSNWFYIGDHLKYTSIDYPIKWKYELYHSITLILIAENVASYREIRTDGVNERGWWWMLWLEVTGHILTFTCYTALPNNWINIGDHLKLILWNKIIHSNFRKCYEASYGSSKGWKEQPKWGIVDLYFSNVNWLYRLQRYWLLKKQVSII